MHGRAHALLQVKWRNPVRKVGFPLISFATMSPLFDFMHWSSRLFYPWQAHASLTGTNCKGAAWAWRVLPGSWRKNCGYGYINSLLCEEPHQQWSHSATGTEFNVPAKFLAPPLFTPNRPSNSMDWRIFSLLLLVLFLFADQSQGIVHLLEIQFELVKLLFLIYVW